jgi:hypothetical protein
MLALDVCKKKMIAILLIVVIIICTSNKLIDKIFGIAEDNTCSFCISIGNNGQITGWTISHFLLFLVLGIMCPNNFTFILVAGISWEILEFMLEYNNKVLNNFISQLTTNSDKKLSSDEFWHYYYGKSRNSSGFYWSSSGGTGQVIDVIMDLLGYITGSYIASYYNS